MVITTNAIRALSVVYRPWAVDQTVVSMTKPWMVVRVRASQEESRSAREATPDRKPAFPRHALPLFGLVV